MSMVDPDVGHTRLFWLGDGATQASPAAVKAEVAKLAFLRGLDADTMDLSAIPAERRRFWPGSGAARQRRRWYAGRASAATRSCWRCLPRPRSRYSTRLSACSTRRCRAGRAMPGTASTSSSPNGPVRRRDGSVCWTRCWRSLRTRRYRTSRSAGGCAPGSVWDACRPRTRRSCHGCPATTAIWKLIEASFGYVREFAPLVLSAVRFAGGTDTGELVAAVGVLRELYATGGRKVPAGTPAEFVPARWQGYLVQAEADGDATAYRHYWELCLLLELRSGDVWVPGSRRYADPAS